MNEFKGINYEDLTEIKTLSDQKIVTVKGVEYLIALVKDNQEFIGISARKGISNSAIKNNGRLFEMFRLKFHICLPERDKNPEFFDKGFEIVSKILMENNILFFKVIKPGLNMSANEDQRGKEITIYAGKNLDKDKNDWTKIITQITQKLIDDNVPPGFKQVNSGNKTEYHINGSKFVSYRYEGKIQFDKEKKIEVVIKELPDRDLISELRIDVKNQPENQAWIPKNDPTQTHQLKT